MKDKKNIDNQKSSMNKQTDNQKSSIYKQTDNKKSSTDNQKNNQIVFLKDQKNNKYISYTLIVLLGILLCIPLFTMNLEYILEELFM